jgi:RHS repeat-associated protein
VYGYDGDGKRVKKTENGATTYYVYSSKLGQSVMEVTANSVQRAYVYGGGKLVAMQATDGQFYWLHTNHLGNSRAMTDTSGNLIYKGQFDPYGTTLTEWSGSGNTNLNSKKFTGYERDSATGLDYAQARMYNSGRGRFMTPDPIGLKGSNHKIPQSLNRYSYVGNDPINFIDPGGMIACPASVCGGPDYSVLWDLWWGRWTMELPIEMPMGDPSSGGGQQDDPKIANRKNVLAIALGVLKNKPDCANLIKSSRVNDPIAFLERLSNDLSQFAENADIPYPAQARTEGVGDNAKISFAKGYWGDLEIEKDQNYGTVHGVKFTVLEWMALDVLHELSHATGKFIHGDSTTYRGNTYDYTITVLWESLSKPPISCGRLMRMRHVLADQG